MSSADRVSVFFVPEVSKGVTPNAAAFVAARVVSESLKATYQHEASKELSADRTEREQILIGLSVAGDLNTELYHQDHKLLMAAACGKNAWTGAATPWTLENGVDMPTFSVLKRFNDVTDANHMFRGCVVNTWNLQIPKKGIVTQSFGLMGMNFVNGPIATVAPGVPTFAAASNNDPFGGATISAILMDDVPFTSCVDNISFQWNNNIRPQECAGSLAPTDFVLGRMQLTGSMDVYFKDESLFNKYKGGNPFELDVTLADPAGNTLAIEIPRAKFEDMEVLAGGTNTDVIAKGKFRALYDPTDARMFKLTMTGSAT